MFAGKVWRLLCWSCYALPGVRERYPINRKFAQRGKPDFHGQAAPAGMPTRALPGTQEKIAVLAQRADLQQDLWHVQDAPGGYDAGEAG